MSTASPTAYLLWAILSILFLGFLLYHLWSYDRFKCLLWSSGRQPGAFKRVMTYSYLGSVPLFVVYSVAMTVIKFKEGFVVTSDNKIIPMPLELYDPANRNWILPLDFVFSFAWALELITHLEELAFWLYLLHQTPNKEEWFNSWEYRMWFMGSVVAFLGMPLTALVARRNVVTLDAWIFLVGSSGSTGTTICFLYVLWCFPRFIRHVKSEGADPTVVVRLATFYQLNLARIVFRFLFTVPLLIIAVDGIVGSKHVINSDLFSTDFLLMVAGIGCFVSTTITLLIFFPRSVVKEAGYKPKPPTAVNSPKSPPITPPLLMSGPFATTQSTYMVPHPTEAEEEEWDDLPFPEESTYHGDTAPPYAGSPAAGQVIHAGVQYGPQSFINTYQRQPFPHSISSPQILQAPPMSPMSPVSPVPSSPRRGRHSRRRSGMVSSGDVHRYVSQDHVPAQPHGLGMAIAMESSSSTLGKGPAGLSVSTEYVPSRQDRDAGYGSATVPASARSSNRTSGGRQLAPNLHPYVMTFTSPIDLVDISPNREELPTRTI